MSLLQYFFSPFGDLDPKMAGTEDCGSLSTHMKSAKETTENYVVDHLWSTQQTLEQGELGNVYRLPGAENPTDGLTRERSDMVPPLRILESGRFNPGSSRPRKGAAWGEGEGCV